MNVLNVHSYLYGNFYEYKEPKTKSSRNSFWHNCMPGCNPDHIEVETSDSDILYLKVCRSVS